MKRLFRLTRSDDYRRVRRCGRSYAHPLMVLIVDQNPEGRIRIGIIASKAVGKAVQRNRAKRRVRSCVDQLLPRIREGYDLIFLTRKPILSADFENLCSVMIALLNRAKLLENKALEIAANEPGICQ